ALKSRPLEELLTAIRTVAAGEALLAPSVTRRLIAHFTEGDRAPRKTPRGLAELTEREREVLALVARGRSNAELAETLHVSLPTVKTHVSRILTKLGARDRTQLVVLAYESGLVTTAGPAGGRRVSLRYDAQIARAPDDGGPPGGPRLARMNASALAAAAAPHHAF